MSRSIIIMENIPLEENDNGGISESSGTIKEGKAEILVQNKNVFYNPVQEFNRDLSILVLTNYGKIYLNNPQKSKKSSQEKNDKSLTGLRILEALSASGLRSIRYAKEVPNIHEIIANDISSEAVKSIKNNIIHNQVENIVIPSHDDAIMIMYKNKKTKFDVVDLDPYGCPSMFLDSGVQSVKDGGILFVTATDMAVLAGNAPETCYVKYGSVSLKSKACHEMALRILLHNIAAQAGKYGRVIEPLLSFSADFYIRVFVRLYTNPAGCKRNTSKIGMVYQCVGCASLETQTLGIMPSEKSYKLPHAPSVEKHCPHCNHKYLMGGPMWLGSLHNKEFINQLLNEIESKVENRIKSLNTIKRIHGILRVVSEELDTPLYYTLDKLMSTVRSGLPPMALFRSAILNAGYKVSYSHANKISIKTDAPNNILWDIVRAWEKENPVKREKLEPNSVALTILNSKSSIEVSFSKHPDAEPYSRINKLTRFQQNPQPHWGPGTRSTTIVKTADNIPKQKQNKKRKREEVN